MLCTFAIALIGLLDEVTSTELRIYPLYVVPIAIAAWRAGLWGGIVASTLAVAAWVTSNYLAGLSSSTAVWVSNTTAHLLAFSTVVVLVTYLQRSRAAEARLARTDTVTHLLNARAFFEAVAGEIERQQRTGRPTTLAYLDLDNFKLINDRFGHQVGNDALVTVARALRETTRTIDILARLGGDEFALLLPETDEQGARRVLERLRAAVSAAACERGWDVTCSIGAVVALELPADVDAIVGMADRLMYRVKAEGKDALRVATYSPSTHGSSDRAASRRHVA